MIATVKSLALPQFLECCQLCPELDLPYVREREIMAPILVPIPFIYSTNIDRVLLFLIILFFY